MFSNLMSEADVSPWCVPLMYVGHVIQDTYSATSPSQAEDFPPKKTPAPMAERSNA